MTVAEDRSLNRLNWLLPLLLVLALGLRLLFLGAKSFWQDEGCTWFIAHGILIDDAYHPLHNNLLKIFLNFFGNNEFAGRLLSVLAGSLFIWFTYLFVKAAFNRKAAFIAAFILTISPYGVALSQEMRMYSLILLEIAAAYYFFWKLCRDGKPSEELKYWAGFFLFSVAGLYTHVIVAFQVAFLTLVYFALNRRAFRKLKSWCFMLFLLGLAYLPQVFSTFRLAGTRRHVWVALNLGELLANSQLIFKSLVTFVVGIITHSFYQQASAFLREHINRHFFILIGLVAALGLMFLFYRYRCVFRQWQPGFNFWLMAASFFFNILLFHILEVSSSRQLGTLYFPLMVILAVMLSSLTIRWRTLLLTCLTLISIISLIQYYRLPYFPYEEVNWREAGQFLGKNAQPSDIVFYQGGRNGFYTLKYYVGDFPCKAEYLNTPKWEADRYQAINWQDYRNQPEKFVRSLLLEFHHVWYVFMPSGPNALPLNKTDTIAEEKSFGPQLKILLLENTAVTDSMASPPSERLQSANPTYRRH
ncbi:MAG: glycosyltransferase family 39 protein [bacterium]|nr:glycosyltransferase family 39 protein [bacterium]